MVISLRRVIFEQEPYRLNNSLINLSVAFSIINCRMARPFVRASTASATAASEKELTIFIGICSFRYIEKSYRLMRLINSRYSSRVCFVVLVH